MRRTSPKEQKRDPGTHEPLVDGATWDRVQVLLGDKVYRPHETYAGELITCGHCGHPITHGLKTKRTKSGEKEYVYYRCSKYNAAGHPRVRITEPDLDRQVLPQMMPESARLWNPAPVSWNTQECFRNAPAGTPSADQVETG